MTRTSSSNVVRAFGPNPRSGQSGQPDRTPLGTAVGAEQPSAAFETETHSSGVVPIGARTEKPALEALPSLPPTGSAPSTPALAPRHSGVVPSRASRLASDHVRMGLLSAVAGYVDAAGFVTLLGMFPAHLTGEIVGMTLAVSSGHASSLRTHLAMIPVFIGSVVLGVMVARAFRRRGHKPLAPLLSLMALALLLFSATGFVVPGMQESSHPLPVLLVSAVAAMGFQNTFMREAVGTTCPTTVMTGNLTQFIIELVDLFMHRLSGSRGQNEAERKKADARLKLVSTALGAFVCGAGLGGWLAGVIGPRSMVLPTLIAAFLAWVAWRDSRD